MILRDFYWNYRIQHNYKQKDNCKYIRGCCWVVALSNLWCQKFSEAGVRVPAMVASQPGSMTWLVNLILILATGTKHTINQILHCILFTYSILILFIINFVKCMQYCVLHLMLFVVYCICMLYGCLLYNFFNFYSSSCLLYIKFFITYCLLCNVYCNLHTAW